MCATRSSASKVEKEAEKESNFAFPGTGDDTPDTEAAEKRRIEAAEAAQSAIAGRDQELDPEANRDRVRNLDDSTEGVKSRARAVRPARAGLELQRHGSESWDVIGKGFGGLARHFGGLCRANWAADQT